MDDTTVFGRSGVLRSATYDRQNETLLVRLEHKTNWLYTDVPIVVYRGLIGAKSAGAYYNMMIKGKYNVIAVEKEQIQ